jgi:nucleoside-diphosphate-sugar epimerase
VYGYYEEKRRLIPTLGLNFIQWISPNLSNPDSVRDYIFIDDVVDCYLNIDKILWDFGGIYNIWSGNQYTISEVVASIKTIVWSIIEPNYGTKISAQFEPKTWVANNDKMINTFKQEPMTLFRWLEKTIKRLKINNHLYI